MNSNSDGAVLAQEEASEGLLSVATLDSNQFGLYVSQVDATTRGTRNYEKGAIYASVLQYDTSTGTGAIVINKDAVALEAAASVVAGNKQGRIWGATFNTTVSQGSQGAINGIEVDVNNSSGADAIIGALNPAYKNGITAVSLGTNRPGPAYDIEATGAPWLVGLYSLSANVSRDFIELQNQNYSNIFAVDTHGNLTANDLSANGSVIANGENPVVLTGSEKLGTATITTRLGSISLSASGTNSTLLGSDKSAVSIRGKLVVKHAIDALGGLKASNYIKLPSYTVSSLPACNVEAIGEEVYVTDAISPTYLGPLRGGGSSGVKALCRGVGANPIFGWAAD